MQQTEGDLGAPGEFEELVETATLLGDSVILDSDGPDGLYVQRRFKALERGIPLFNTTACLDPDTKEMAAAIGEAMYDQAESADMLGKFLGAFKNKEAARRERTLQTAAAALAINAADWMLLENAGEVLSKKEQGKQHIVASVFPLSLDVARKADILGLQVDVRRINADSWPFDVTKESFILPSILATGKFDSTLV